jgi:NAD(P)-dependent dehydrogenase (short-subunit alcohol dehydrogenase family)
MTRTDDSEVPDYRSLLSLDGKNFIVLGAGQGIGRQAAHALAAVGARVFCVDLDAGLADDIAKEVGGVPWAGDAIEQDSAERLYQDAETALGRIDGIVDIIGMAKYAGLLETDHDSWAWHHGIVLQHAVNAIRFGAPRMIASGGGVLTVVASVSGMQSAPSHGAYGAYKAALMSLVRTAAVELGPKGLRVNAVAPGLVMTPRVAGYLSEAEKERGARNAPLRRSAFPADIAEVILFLCTGLSSYITGQTIVVDGGVSAKFGYSLPGED